jgi:hypothetical protein
MSTVVKIGSCFGQMQGVTDLKWILMISLAATCLMSSCTRSADPPERKPQQAGQAVDPVELAARIAASRAAAAVGDRKTVEANLHAIDEDFRKSIKLADPARRVDRESARLAARRVDGVRSVAWIDHENLFVIVARNDARSYDTIDAICVELESLGDTLGVVVNLQSGAATNGDDLAILSRNCQLAPGDRALLQSNRQVDVVPSEVRAQHRASNPGSSAQELDEWKRRNRESMRAIEDSTPEM